MPTRFPLVLCLVFLGCASRTALPTAPPPEPRPAPGPPTLAPEVPPVVAPDAPPETLAACLARKGVHLYGASWCHWCHVQLKMFGADAGTVPYTDCQPDDTYEFKKSCEDAGVVQFETPLPVWILADGTQIVGVQSLKKLAEAAGCPLPP